MKKKSPSDIFETRRIIRHLEKLSFDGTSQDEYKTYLGKLLHGVPLMAIDIKNEEIYRARYNQKGRIFSHVSELLNPSPNLVTVKGRFNDVGESIIYMALCELGTLIELRTELNKFFTITKIKKNVQSDPIAFPLGFKDRFLPKVHINKSNQAVIDFLHGQITKEVQNKDEYNLTIALAHIMLYKEIVDYPDMQKGLVYPSVQSKLVSNKTTFNLAFTPDAFHKHFSVESATIYVLVNEPSCYKLLDINFGEVLSDGSLLWRYSFNEMQDRLSRGLMLNDKFHEKIIGMEKSL